MSVTLGIVSPELTAQTLAVRTLAGSTTGGGHLDGTGPNARFSVPHGVAYDSAGAAYIADSGNHVIRRMTPDGHVTTFAGLVGQPGSANGTRSSARFNYPTGIAIDGANNLYIADSNNHTIRKISASGSVTTLAGTAGATGQVDATGSAARFWFPTGVAVEPSGANLYVADRTNQVVRKVTAAGVVTNLAGTFRAGGFEDGFGTQANFDDPYGIAIGPTGDLFVADTSNNAIRRVTVDGRVTTLAGDGTTDEPAGSRDGTGLEARFNAPASLAVAANGDVYVTDTINHTIRKITPAGVTTTLAGAPGFVGSVDGVTTSARFRYPAGIAVNPNGGVLVADTDNHAMRRLAGDPATVTTVAGSKVANGAVNGTGPAARFHYPNAVAFDSAGNVYVADSAHTIRKVTPAGVVTTFAGSPGASGADDGIGGSARFRSPSGIAIGPGDVVYVADTGNHTIRKITADGTVTTLAGAAGQAGDTNGIGSAARFDSPFGIAVDAGGNVYVADTFNHQIRIIEPSGVTAYAGLGRNYPGNNDGVGTGATFRYPTGLAIDSARNIYVADWGNHTIRRIAANGTVTTPAGLFQGHADGTGLNARFNHPNTVAVDGAGMVYVVDSDNHAIRRMTPAGQVTTVAGLPLGGGNQDGTGTAARFFYPQGLAFSTTLGQFAVADTYNHNIRIAELAPPRITSFVATPAGIQPGASATLQWTTTDAASAILDNGIGAVALNGSRIVTPSATTTYRLTVTGPGGTTTETVTVYVLTNQSKRRAAKH